MEALPGKAVSLWRDSVDAPSYPPLEGTQAPHVVVIGGGIVGVTAAYVLKKAGVKVCLIENRRLGSGTTGRTTAKVTSLHGLAYRQITSTFGREKAALYGRANENALKWVTSTVARENIDCDLLELPAYTFTASDDEVDAIEEEARLAAELGLPASYTEDIGLPVTARAAVRFDHQAQFQPLKYLYALARAIPGDGSAVFENTRALDIEAGHPCMVRTNRGDIRAEHVIVATHLPFPKGGLYFARTSPESHPSIAYQVQGMTVPGMYLGIKGSPHSVRSARVDGVDFLVSDTAGYQTGHADRVSDLFRDLIAECRASLPVNSIDYRWEAHDYYPSDNVPYVGPLSSSTKNVYVATGFRAWGMTNGTAAALLLTGLILGQPPEWAGVFDSTRKDVAQVGRMISASIEATRYLVVPRLFRKQESVADLAPGESRIAEIDDERVAVSRNASGELNAVRPACGHTGCFVSWNDAEETWDCPCHASRYESGGTMLSGPTVKDLQTADTDKVRREAETS